MPTDETITDQEVEELINESDDQSEQGVNFNIYNPFRVESKVMTPYQWEGFVLAVDGMPSTIKQLIIDSSTVDFLISLSETYDLSDEQSTKLTILIRDILMGKVFIGSMTERIQTSIGLDPQTAKQARDQIIRDLFAPAIEDIKIIQQKNFANKSAAEPAAAPEPPVPQKLLPAINPDNIVDLRNN
jgi:hypothetical protein